MPKIPESTLQRLGLSNGSAPSSSVPTPSPQKEMRRERLAMAVDVLERMESSLRFRVAAFLDLAKPFLPDKNREKQPALEFKCLLVEAATICDIIRSEFRKGGKTDCVLWMMRKESWSRVPMDAVFTTVRQGVRVIHPDLFADAIVKAPVSLLPPDRIRIQSNGRARGRKGVW